MFTKSFASITKSLNKVASDLEKFIAVQDARRKTAEDQIFSLEEIVDGCVVEKERAKKVVDNLHKLLGV